MNCSGCGNIIKIPEKCNICGEKFCSEECLQSHSKLFHQSLAESIIITHSNNNNSFAENNSNSQFSPFYVKGIFNKDEIKYDPVYSLDNFSLIYSKGIPQLIGDGSFGQVYLAKNNINKKIYAIKHMEKNNLLKYLDDLDQIYREIDIQSRINHPNIIQLLYMKETNETFDLVLEYAKYGTLFDFVVNSKGLMEKLVFKFFIQIVNAIKFLHDNNIIHRDIKPENILLFDNYVVKLCDFGWSIKCESRLPGGSFSGTTEYMSPELINREDYGKEIDIWMLGILLYELVHGFSPFRPKRQNFEDEELIQNIKNHNILFYMPTSDEYKELVFRLLETDVNKRYNIDDIYNSKFVKKYEMEEYGINYNINNEVNDEENTKYEINSINTNNSETSFENEEQNNLLTIKKNLLMNRYENNDDKKIARSFLNNKDLSPIYSNKKGNINLIKMIKKEKDKGLDNLTNSKFTNFEDKDDQDILSDDQNEDEPNAPRNNRRNRKKKIENKSNLESNISNKGEEQNEKKNLTNSNKNSGNKKNKKEKLKKNLNLILPNTIINNNLHTSRRYHDSLKEDLESEKNGENTSIESKKITNVIFHNKENNSSKNIQNKKFNDVENNSKLLNKKLTLNQPNAYLSLSLSPGTANYNSLLNSSVSPDIQYSIPKVQNQNLNIILNNAYIFPPITESQNLSNISKNFKEFPFDHFASNSSLDIHQPIFNNKMKKNKKKINVEKKEKEIIISDVKEKEPNDNMRRRNKKIKNEIPLDNVKKELKEVKPEDNYNKTKENVKNYDAKTISSSYTEKENINININKKKPIIEDIPEKIFDNINYKSNEKNKRNYSVSNTNILRRKKNLIVEELNKGHLFKTANSKKKINQKKNIKAINDNKKDNKNFINKKTLFIDTVKEKVEEESMPIKKLNNKNNSFVVKNNENKNLLAKKDKNINDGKKMMKKQNNILSDKKAKKGKSVNKQRDFQFNKENQKLKMIKSSRDIIKNNKELGIKKKKLNINIKINNNKKEKNEKVKITEENKTKKNEDINNISKITKIRYKKENNQKIKKDNATKNITNLNIQINNLKANQEKGSKISLTQENDNTKKSMNKNTEAKSDKKEKNLSKKNQKINKNEKYNINNSDEKPKININNKESKNNEQLTTKKEKLENQNIIKQKINSQNPLEIQETKNQIKIAQSNKNKIKENLSQENKENLKKDKNIKLRQSNIIIENELIEDKYDNFKVKEISRHKEIIKNSNTDVSINSNIKTDPMDKHEKDVIKNNEKLQKNGIKIKSRDSLDNYELKKNKNIKPKIENNKLKLCFQKISQTDKDDSFSKEQLSTRINIESINKIDKSIYNDNEINTINKKIDNQKSPRNYPKKIGSDSNSSNSSIYEYEKSDNKEENKNIHSSSKKKINFSNSELKTTNYSKKNVSNIEKIKSFSEINFDIKNNKIKTNIYKSKSPDTKKHINLKEMKESQIEYKAKENIKNKKTNKNRVLNTKELSKEQKFKQMHKNNTDCSLNKNLKINELEDINNLKNDNKENLRLNKRINSEKFTNNIDINNNANDKNKNLKKKNKKSLNKEGKNEINQNEIYNDSESYIIDGDSEYGDSQAL